MTSKHYLVVGAGIAGATMARQLVENLDCRVTILEEKTHLAGNCHSQRDEATGVMVHVYGPHIFHTNREEVWQYIHRFEKFQPFINRVKASNSRGVFSMPINLHTINQFFNQRFNPAEAREFLASLGDRTITEPRNFEEQALKFVGRELYDAFFYGYTRKQWGCEPTQLPATILKRLPIRFNYDDNYYNSAFQGIPTRGYTAMVEAMVDHPRIEVKLSTRFERGMESAYDHTFYTGPLDACFGFACGRLGYRTVTFERIEAVGDFQGNAVINYPDTTVDYTRIHEHKHFAPWEEHARTVAFKEYSKETTPEDLPYYPKRLAADLAMLHQYRALAKELPSVSFLGRLGTYRYMDMDAVIGETLDFAALFIKSSRTGETIPPFFNQENHIS
jgi:UDP-galactopyranose mutase